MLIINHDAELVSDIFLYARDGEGVGMGGYDVLCNGSSVVCETVKFRNGKSELNCAYLQTLQRAFVKAADHLGKAALVAVDPDKKILQPKTKKMVTPIERKFVKFVFRFHIPYRDVLDVLRGTKTMISVPEERLKNLIKLMFMDIQNTKTPYWNLKTSVEFEFNQCKESDVSILQEYVDREMDFLKIKLQ